MKKQRGPKWWCVGRAGTSVLLGIATTLVVAYGGAVIDSTLDFGGYGDGDLYMLRQTNRWWDVVTVMNGDGGEGTGSASASASASVALVRAVKSWEDDTIAEVVRAGNASGWPQDVVMIGWPARCMWGVKGGVEQRQFEGLVEVPVWLEEMRYVYHPLPTRVWWPGMVANVGLFGGAWLLVLAGPPAVRRVRGWRRARMGLCVSCGYDLKGAEKADGVCPECGVSTGGRVVRSAS